MIEILSATHQGLKRTMNQDTMASSLPEQQVPAWALVCDGMGGHNAGNVAAELARDSMAKALQRGLRPGMELRSVQMLLETAVENAGTAVYDRAAGDEALHGMGTTVVAAVVLGDTLCLCHAGDSRAYLIRGQEVQRLTKDHSVVQGLIDRGEITPKQALSHPERHFITKALGVGHRVGPEFGQAQLEDGDRVLLCSDGLYGMVPEEEFPALCAQAQAESSAQCLIDRANELGGADNITAVLLCLRGEPAAR